MKGPRVFFYVQHLLGIGHLVRASRISTALAGAGFEVAVAAGGCSIEGFPDPGIRTIPLPGVRAGSNGFSALDDCKGRPVDETFKAARREQLLSALAAERPDVVVIEAFPFGRRMMRFELVPLLAMVQEMRPRPLVVCSVRDILQHNARPERVQETADCLAQFFDLVLVHGDPRFARLEETFALAHTIADKIRYTGLVAGPPPAPAHQSYRIVVSAGGGVVGAALVSATLQVLGAHAWARPACLITGPMLAGTALRSLEAAAPADIDIVPFRKDLPDLLASAELSISQAGYNTVCDLLQARCRALLVPFAGDGETEQTMRAHKLQALGLAEVVAEDEATPERLAAAIDTMLQRPKPAGHHLDLYGAHRAAQILKQEITRRGRSA
jgi:predicted glycosyltransferase